MAGGARGCGEDTGHLPSTQAVSPRRAGARGTACILEGANGVLGLRPTRLACGKLERALPARMRENGRPLTEPGQPTASSFV